MWSTALFSCLAVTVLGQVSVVTIDGTVIPNVGGDQTPTGSRYTYLSYASQITVSTGDAVVTGSINGTALSTSSGPDITAIAGGSRTISGSGTTTGTGSAPTNTQPCNNYPEFCNRQYSNITEVAAHNSPYAIKNNAASNQNLDVTQQLNDGVRMLQGSVHFENNTLWFCHTSCDLLNAGTVEAYLTTVVAWLRSNPYEVVSILFGNSDQVSVTNYVAPIQNSGLVDYVYTPPKIPMAASDWPTLGQMILSQKRVVIFMDYSANQQEVPYVLDQYSQLWQTPFSPTNINFPCTVDSPPNLSDDQARERMYLANHNLNTEVNVAGTSFLIPNTAELNVTNGVNGTGSLGNMTEECTADWGKPPNFLIVDYYNIGPFNGSVFEVAAQANGVTYNRQCCGQPRSAASLPHMPSLSLMLGAIFVACLLMI